jgi:hypothetical protein
VSSIADKMLLTMDGILDEIEAAEPEPQAPAEEPPAEQSDEYGEDVLWKGRPLLSIVEHYILTSERLKITRGFISRDVEYFELIRVQDIDFKQGISERILGIGDITVRGQDASQPAVVLRNVANPEEVYELMRRAWLETRKRHGLQFREFM